MEQYYNIKTGSNQLVGGDGCYLSDDVRVSCYYKPVPFGYERDRDKDGFPILIPFQLKEDGTMYSAYVRSNGENIPDYVIIEKLERDERIAEIYEELSSIDVLSQRPLRAIVLGSSDDLDIEKVTTLEAEAVALRVELSELLSYGKELPTINPIVNP